MSENIRYWLWLQQALGAGAPINAIIEDFGSAKAVYESNLLEWKMSPALTVNQINKLERTELNSVEETIYTCEQNGWQIIDYDDERYPNRLKTIYNPPAVLYVDGELPDIDSLACIGIVGTRKASEYALKTAHIMSRGITEAGALVISGGALGVDSSAHRGAIMSGGKTVAVLGCGLGTNYLMKNRSLRELISANGAVVTEYPPFVNASKTTFPLRNRIISGLSVGVLIVEASVNSGSLITASHAAEQGRDIFAIPSSVLDIDFRGTNKLIEDGAYVATSPESIIDIYKNKFATLDPSKVRSVEELMYDSSDRSRNVRKSEDYTRFDKVDEGRKLRAEKEEKVHKLEGDLEKVYNALTDSFEDADIIMERAELSSGKVGNALVQLELLGLVEKTSGRRYKQS